MFKLLHNMYFFSHTFNPILLLLETFQKLAEKVKVVWDIRGIKKEVKAGLGIDHWFFDGINCFL